MTNDTANPRRPRTRAEQRLQADRARRLELVTDQWLAELTRGRVVPLHAKRVQGAHRLRPSKGRDRESAPEPSGGA
jgi:hypothetical protein